MRYIVFFLLLSTLVYGLPGDLNQDGVLSVVDLVSIVNLIESGQYDEQADLNADLQLNILDLMAVVRNFGTVPNSCGDLICDAGEADTCYRDCKNANFAFVRQSGVHAAYSPDGHILAVDTAHDSAFYDVAFLSQNREFLSVVTDQPRHNGWPTWHPSGRFIVYQAEEAVHYDMNPVIGFPGYGFFSNLWVSTPAGDKKWQLTDIPIKQEATDGIAYYAVVHPIFSDDGNTLMWTERYAKGGIFDWGKWQVKAADVVVQDNVLSINNERSVVRAQDICAECNYVIAMGFLDDQTLLLAGNLDGQHPFGMDLYQYDMPTARLTNLLNTPSHWEEGSCISPDKQYIVFMSDEGSEHPLNFNDSSWETQPRSGEYYIMRTDGSQKQQLTHFNTVGSDDYDFVGGRRTKTAICSWHPDGKRLVMSLQIDERADDQTNVTLHLAQMTLGDVDLPPPIPFKYREMYGRLYGYLAAIEKPEQSTAIKGAELLSASNMRGPILFQSQGGIRLNLNRFEEIGIEGVTVSVNYPFLVPSHPDSQSYIDFYTWLAQEVKSRDMTLVVEVTPSFGAEWGGPAVDYTNLTYAQFKTELTQMIQIIIDAMQPHYLTIITEPDTASHNTGVIALQDPRYVLDLVEHIVSSTNAPATKLGAGAGIWSSPAYFVLLANSSLDYVDLHSYPSAARGENALQLLEEYASSVRQTGKEVIIGEAWQQKVMPNTLPDATSPEIFKRDAYSFWEPLDIMYLDALIATANNADITYISPFWSKYFSAYLPYTATLDDLPALQSMSLSSQAAAQALIDGNFTQTGLHYHTR